MDTLPVLISCEEKQSDGLAFADPPMGELDGADHWYADIPVRVVPAGVITQSLTAPRQFGKYQQRFGRISKEEYAQLRAIFELIEFARSERSEHARNYLDLWAVMRREQRASSVAKDFEVIQKTLTRLHTEHLRQHGAIKTLMAYMPSQCVLKLWRNHADGSLGLGFYAGSFFQALRMNLFLNLLRPDAPAICARCGTRFMRTKVGQTFCSTRCGNAVRKARQRERNATERGEQ